MAYFVADEKLQGYYVSGGVTINIVKYHFECDDAASLPAQTAFISSKKVKISMASTAHTIDTDTLYKMDSSGAWVQQSQPWQPLADYTVLSNKPQINGHTLTGNQSGADLGLQNTLTFDSTPTQDSTNPVTSGGVWTDQQRQDALQTEDRDALVEIVDGGAKNLLFFNDMTTGNRNGLDFVINSDGSISVSGTQTSLSSQSYVVLRVDGSGLDPSSWCDGNHVLSGCPSGGSESKYYISIAKGTTYVEKDYGSGVLLSQTSVTGLYLIVTIAANYTISDSITFKPMICTKAAWKISQTFQPYRPSWQEMWNAIQALQSGDSSN